ncbi:MAG TPA: CoA transferase [Chloroflexota bacterium]|nr:CoA transferase [Chloroflexota bacterium]
MLPLEGIRVVELTTGAAGPTVAKCLSEYGAEVVKIESRNRPDSHRGGPKEGRLNKSPDFAKLSRNKKSLTVNMQTNRGKDLVRDLIRVSDVVVENFSLGVMERWGMAYDQLREIKPDVILIRLKGLGCTGPHAHHVTYGPNLLALFGMTHLWNHPNAPTPTGEARTQHPDFMSGIAGAAAVMSALLYRQRTGQGMCIDSSQAEAGASLLGPYYLDWMVNHRDPGPSGNDQAGCAPHGAYPCAGEDKWCVLSVRTEVEWQAFCRAAGHPEWLEDQRFAGLLARREHRAELDALVSAWTRDWTANEVAETLQAAGVIAAPVQDVEDQFERNPQFAARGLYVNLEEPEMGPLVTEGPPVKMSETSPQVYAHAPLLGEHTDYVVREILKLSDAEIQELTSEGVLD